LRSSTTPHFAQSLQGGRSRQRQATRASFSVVTFNVWFHKDRIGDVAKFPAKTDADLS
jgi:hypothetical protein